MRVGLHRMIVIDICRNDFRVVDIQTTGHDRCSMMERDLVFGLIGVLLQPDIEMESCLLSGVVANWG